MALPDPHESSAPAPDGAGRTGKTSGDDADALRDRAEQLQRERDELQGKLEQIAEVIGVDSTDKIVHDVRNVMNELVLLRKLNED